MFLGGASQLDEVFQKFFHIKIVETQKFQKHPYLSIQILQVTWWQIPTLGWSQGGVCQRLIWAVGKPPPPKFKQKSWCQNVRGHRGATRSSCQPIKKVPDLSRPAVFKKRIFVKILNVPCKNFCANFWVKKKICAPALVILGNSRPGSRIPRARF